VFVVAAGLYNTNKDTNEQLEIARSDQLSARFAEAVGQLGQEDQRPGDKLSIRLGAVYAMAQLMRDSGGYRTAIVDVLCAFVRTHAAEETPGVIKPGRSSVDVLAAFNTVAKRPYGDPALPKDNFVGAQLSTVSAQLDHAVLAGAALKGAFLTRADFIGADLRGASFEIATLKGSNFSGADLRSTSLKGANLVGANLVGANLSGAILDSALLQGADLQRTNVTSAQLRCVSTDQLTRLPAGVAPTSRPGDPGCRS
jgi:hypothetical protein